MPTASDLSAYSALWFDQNVALWRSVLIDWLHWDGTPNLTALEIGCFEGRASVWLLKHLLTHSTSRLVVVDTFQGSPEHGDVGDLFDRFEHNVQPWRERVIVHVGRSADVLRTAWEPIDDGALDLVYVDGSHRASDVLTDAVLAWRLLRTGGLLIFDDYAWQYTTKAGEVLAPKAGIDAFLAAFAGQYTVVASGYQVMVRKR